MRWMWLRMWLMWNKSAHQHRISIAPAGGVNPPCSGGHGPMGGAAAWHYICYLQPCMLNSSLKWWKYRGWNALILCSEGDVEMSPSWKRWNAEMLRCWNVHMLTYWDVENVKNITMLECWNAELLEFWNAEMVDTNPYHPPTFPPSLWWYWYHNWIQKTCICAHTYNVHMHV